MFAAALLPLASCASLGRQEQTCAWVEVVLDGVELGAGGGLLRRAGTDVCGTSEEYVLRRGDYVVDMWNGSGLSAELFIRARNARGVPLEVRSPTLSRLNSLAAKMTDERQLRYDYVMRAPANVERQTPIQLSFSVLAPDGTVVGSESIGLLVKAGRFFSRDSY